MFVALAVKGEDRKASHHRAAIEMPNDTTPVLLLRDKTALESAMLEAENGEVAALNQWYQDFVSAGNSELVVVEDTVDSHRGRQRSNFGSPLYIATVLNLENAVNTLLALGENANYTHPEHGDGPVLHACERGYDDLLIHLLAADGFDCNAAPMTIDRKTLLGQGVPQYEEGMLTPLALAARSARLSTVQLILAHPPAVAAWLHRPDSFGRNVVEATCDMLSLKRGARGASAPSPVVADLEQIVAVLCAAMGKDAMETLAEVPDHATAVAAERRRQRTLRARCLQAQTAHEAASRERGLAAIAEQYVPLHPSIYSATAPLDLAPLPLSEGVKEPIDGVLTFPLLSRSCCDRLWEEMHHYEAAAALSTSLPLHVRHDGNLGRLEAIGFEPALRAIEAAIAPVLTARLRAEHGGDGGAGGGFEVYHAFLTRNFVGRASNATFKMHCDKSSLTINVCLHASEDLEGSTVGFYQLRQTDEPTSVPEDPTHRVYTHAHDIGTAVVHDGRQWHRTDPILKGTRGSLILWARKRTDNPRPEVGQRVRLRPDARVCDGVLADGRTGVLKADDGVSRQPFEVASPDGSASSFYHTTDLVVVVE